MAPFLKWAGGKRWLATSPLLPDFSNAQRYVEPFLGSGALYFHFRPKQAILSDLNAELINTYEVIRDNPASVISGLDGMQQAHSDAFYYETRATVPEDKTSRAIRFIYLNRTCWNGLYRVNKQGIFNVPRGTKNAVVMPSDDFYRLSAMLQTADIVCCDFEATLDMTNNGDCAFIDPPYTVQHNNNGFIKYNEHIFSWADQQRLCKAITRAISRGVRVVLTNADHQSIHQLYEGVLDYHSATRASVLAGSASARNRISEALYVSTSVLR